MMAAAAAAAVASGDPSAAAGFLGAAGTGSIAAPAAPAWRAASDGPRAAWYFSASSGKALLGDVPSRGEWVRFCDADAAALEARFAARPDAYEGAWRAARAEAAPGTPAGAAPPLTAAPRDAAGEPPVLVRSGLHEVCLPSATMWPAYWEAPARSRVLRATWFVRRFGVWEPLGAPLAEALESAWLGAAWTRRAHVPHAGTPGGLLAARVDCADPHVPPGSLHALFVDERDQYLVLEGVQAKLQRAVGLDGGDKAAPGLRLRRGWRPDDAPPLGEEEAADERAAATPPSHLLLVTHGIGHRLQFVDVAADAAALRAAVRTLSPAHVPPGGRLVVLPVQWRKALDLRAERLLDSITPDAPSLRPLRAVLNALALDVLSYWTHTAQEMTDALTTALNAAHARFAARNPAFAGPVSIAAHSLGSVLAWDVLCNQPEKAGGGDAAAAAAAAAQPAFSSPLFAGGGGASDYSSAVDYGGDPRVAALRAQLAATQRELEAARSARGRVYAPLAFRCDTLAMLGSPLALFLALQQTEDAAGRDANGDGGAAALRLDAHALPACRRVLNVLHPHDPVAYRLEPLLNGAATRPALVPYFRNGGRRLGVELAERVEAIGSSLRGMGALSAAAFARLGLAVRPEEPRAAVSSGAAAGAAADGGADGPRTALRRLAGAPGDAPDDAARVDFVLQAAEVDMPLLQAFTAHLSYWADADVALFLLRAAGPAPDVPPLLPAPGGPAPGGKP